MDAKKTAQLKPVESTNADSLVRLNLSLINKEFEQVDDLFCVLDLALDGLAERIEEKTAEPEDINHVATFTCLIGEQMGVIRLGLERLVEKQ